MTFFYVSDLHLRRSDEPRARHLIAMLRELPKPGDVFVFGGDVFDLFVGDKAYFRAAFREVLDAVASAAGRGVEIRYLEGNHDFHVRGIFGDGAPVSVIDDDFAVEWDGKKIWVCHGDQINRRDYGYLLLRFVTRTIFFRALLRAVPGAWIGKIGSWSSGTSRKYSDVARASGTHIESTRELFRAYAREKFREGFDCVLIGHSHIADRLSERDASGAGREYVNLGYSDDHVPLLAWREGRPIHSSSDGYQVIRKI